MTPPTFFTPAQLAKVVAETIPADDPATHLVVGTVDLVGVQLVASFKKRDGSNWELQAVARHDWTGETTVGGKVILKW